MGRKERRPVCLPVYKEVKWFEDGKRVSLPDNFYSSRNIVDKMIQYLDEADAERPFFGYLSFQAVHLPVQAPRELVDKSVSSSSLLARAHANNSRSMP